MRRAGPLRADKAPQPVPTAVDTDPSNAAGSQDRVGGTKSDPGAMLRAHRRRHQLTLSEVSERTGLPTSTLSKLENGKVSFTYDKLAQVARGLGIDIVELLTPHQPPSPPRVVGRRSISRAGDGVPVDSGSYDYRILAADLLDKRCVPMVGVHHARSLEEFGEMMQHPGEEFIYVLEGTLELHTSIYAPLRLDKGDSVYFDSDMPHAYINAGPEPCKVLSICSDPKDAI